jgi:hypothetical protein
MEHPNVSLEHLQVREPPLGGSFSEDLATVGVPFDGADGLMPENKVCEESSASSGEEMERLDLFIQTVSPLKSAWMVVQKHRAVAPADSPRATF